MKAAYEIPFYRKRFDEHHLTPDDFHCSEDLVKFPVLTKAELRAWMKEMYDTHPESRDSWDATSTSGSTGVPLTLYQSQREHACTNANWIRVLMTFGYNPFFGKMITFESSYRKEKSSMTPFCSVSVFCSAANSLRRAARRKACQTSSKTSTTISRI